MENKTETRFQRYYRLNRDMMRQKRRKYYQAHKIEECEKRRKYHILNREKELEYNKKYNEINKEKRSEYNHKYHQEHKDEIREQKKKYFKTERGRYCVKVKRNNRRALLKDLSILSVDVIQQVYERNIRKYGTLTCDLCFKPVEFGKDTLEHFTPLVRGGTNEKENLGIAHKMCNSLKARKTLDEYLTEKIKNLKGD